MIWTGIEHACGHPLVIDTDTDPPRCAVCHGSLSWRRETWPYHPHPHNLEGAA